MEPALHLVVREVEEHVAREGWDQPIRLFAIVLTSDVLASNPELQLTSSQIYTSVEQEIEPGSDSLETLLGTIAWPKDVRGAIVVTERIVIDESDSHVDSENIELDELMTHPNRHDVRLVSAVLRDGATVNAIRYRQFDSSENVAFAADLVPSLNAAMLATFE